MKSIISVLLTLLTVIAAAPATATERLDRELRALLADPRPVERAASRGLATRGGRFQVEVVVADGRRGLVADELRAAGALSVLEVRDRVQAFVRPETLAELERLAGVVAVRPPLYGVNPEPGLRPAEGDLKLLAVTSEGFDQMNAAAWHAEGLTGAGARVGVIDLEFGGWEDLVGVELPAGRTFYRAFGGSQVEPAQVHGTACAEIVADIAPDAELYLAHITTGNDLFAALDWLASEGVRVVTMSVGFYGAGPGDGSGVLDSEISAFVLTADAVFITSAGNERRSHWQGESIDDDGDGWVDFAPGDDLNELAFTVSSGDTIGVYLTWNDWSAPTSDYSLHLYNLDGVDPVEVAVSDRGQTGSGAQTPFERINHTAADDGRYGVRINRTGVSGQHDLEFFTPISDLENRVAEGSLTVPADSDLVIAAASVSYSGSYGVRSYSSAGPTNGPGGSFDGGSVKPDLAGYDGVSTVSYGTRSFYGTSAASPHIAGAAALIRSADPALDTAAVREFLEVNAIDLGTGGKDNDTGWGRVFLGQVPGSSCTYGVDPSSLSLPAAGGGGLIQVTTDDGCPWTASSQVGWITVAPPSGSGSADVGYVVDDNPEAAERTGQIVVAGETIVVVQAGAACSVTVFPTGQAFGAAGGDGLFSVETDPDCVWTATTDAGWITLTSASGTGVGNVLFQVQANLGAAQRSATIDVGDGVFTVTQSGTAAQEAVRVAGIAETEGLEQTRWKSALAILNPTDAAAVVDLRYHHDGAVSLNSMTVDAGALVELDNVAGDFFASPDSAGAVEVRSPVALIVSARTYNDAPSGTFGQFLPGVADDGSIGDGDVAVLAQLRSGDGFRTNIGFVDLSGGGGTARIRLFNGAGGQVGDELEEVIPANGWQQRSRVFTRSGAGDCTGCYALIDLTGGAGPIWAYASVVDNGSGDPTTVPMAVVDQIGGASRYLVAGIAEIEGAEQTRWRSNLALLNLSGGMVTADLAYDHEDGVETLSTALADGELVELEDAAAAAFGAPDSSGIVAVDADGPLVVTARTFNDAPDGTFGQYLPGHDDGAAFGPGEQGYLSQLRSDAEFRTNIGFANHGEFQCAVRTFLHDDTGLRRGMFFLNVPPSGWVQENRVFERYAAAGLGSGYAVVEVLTGGCRIWAYASVVDNGSGDPTTVPVVVR